MPFWWGRRKRWWRGRRRPWYRRRYTTKRKRRRIRKYRRGRPYRRYRRRHKKVRRKRRKLPVTQWQPDKIQKCKIKGVTVIVLGAEGKQFRCYTNESEEWTPLKTPGGGGFGVEKYTLQFLYREYHFGNNIWTKTNLLTDLSRYLGCQFIFYRHPYTDFIASYDRNLPMTINKYTYANTHPQALLLSRHKKIIPSKQTKPQGRNKVKMRIRPSKVLLDKWFFQEHFSDTGLVLIKAAAANFNYAHIGSSSQNQIITLFALNPTFYHFVNWGEYGSTPYTPYTNATSISNYKSAAKQGPQNFTKPTSYADSVDYTKGWFNTILMQLTEYSSTQQALAKPIVVFRYNPTIDDGKGNAVYFFSVLKQLPEKPKSDLNLILENIPIWQALYGFSDFVKSVKPDPNFLASYALAIQSKYVEPFSSHGTGNIWIPIDLTFIQGKGPYGQPIGDTSKQKWFPTFKNQQESINAFVESGPYIPKYSQDKQSTWELHAFYQFYFKWGGTFTEDNPVADPSKQATYVTPDYIKQKLQIINPAKQKAQTLLHSWDYRRGLITGTAIKRICEDQPTDTDFQTGSEYSPPQKKKKTTKEVPYPPAQNQDLQKCLLSLFEESTSKEAQDPQTLQQLIQQQRKQQQELKYNILKVISDLKQQQQLMQLHTGFIN
nr:MAG: ORF1 [Torque teno midi virus]